MAERTAHDGFVVGSNPTKLKTMKKQKNFKNYKTLKIKSIFEKENIICMVSMAKPLVKIRNSLSAQGIKVLHTSNLDLSEVLQNSVLANYATLVSGSMSIITLEKNSSYLNLTELQLKIMKKTCFLGLVINNKVYLSDSLVKTNRDVNSAAKVILSYSLKKKKTFFALSKQSKAFLKLAHLKKIESKQRDLNT